MRIADIIARAQRLGHIKYGLVICDNCGTPASRSLSLKLHWVGCAVCVTGEANSYDPADVIAVGQSVEAVL